MNEITITVERNVDLQLLSDAVVTALEGGSNYWYFLKDEACDILQKYEYKPLQGETLRKLALSECVVPAILAGEKIPVHDAEDPENDEPLGFLNLDNLKRGLDAMVLDKRPELECLFSENAIADANDADVIFQYIVLGEITFG